MEESIAEAKTNPHGKHVFNDEAPGILSFEDYQKQSRSPDQDELLGELKKNFLTEPNTRVVKIDDPRLGFPSTHSRRILEGSTQQEIHESAVVQAAQIAAASSANGGNPPELNDGEFPWDRKAQTAEVAKAE